MKDRKLDGVRRDAETLAKLVGLTVAFNSEEWDATRQVYRKLYAVKGISGVELEYDPVPYVILQFLDGTVKRVFSIGEFEKFIGRVDEYGSISEYLSDRGFSLFNLCFQD